MLANRLAECNIHLRSNARSDAHTSLAVVSFDETNQPHYAFYRERTADREIPVNEIIASFPKSMSIFQGDLRSDLFRGSKRLATGSHGS